MGTLMRKLNRQERRRMGHNTITSAEAKNIALKTYASRRDEDISEAYGQIITIALLYMHNEYGYGEKRLKKWLWGFDDFIEAVQGYGKGHMEEVCRILREDCGVDIQEEYRLLCEVNERKGKP